MYIGLDLSTQKLKALILTESLDIYRYFEVNFDKELSQFNTQNGVIISTGVKDITTDLSDLNEPTIKLEVKCPTLLWVAALDLIFEKMKEEKINLADIKGISGCAQQHGSVYWKAGYGFNYNVNQDLCSNLKDAFAVNLSPVWLDSSTATECSYIRKAVAEHFLYGKQIKNMFKRQNYEKLFDGIALEHLGDSLIAETTGSNVQERFTLPQILKIAVTDTKNFLDTGHISLVSNFLSSVLIGKMTPFDYGDASGMNLMNLLTKTWDEDILNSVENYNFWNESDKRDSLIPFEYNRSFGQLLRAKLAGESSNSKAEDFNYFSYYRPDSLNKSDIFRNRENFLPALIPTPTCCGKICQYFVQRYGFSPDCDIVAFTGDNLASLIGSLAISGDLVISLGTSDTIFFQTMKEGELSDPYKVENETNQDRRYCLRRRSHRQDPIDSTHVFVSPTYPFSEYVFMIVYKNGSLTRESIVEQHLLLQKMHTKLDIEEIADLDDKCPNRIWSKFEENIVKSAPGNDGNIGFYFTQSEITPRITATPDVGGFPIIYRYDSKGDQVTVPPLKFTNDSSSRIRKDDPFDFLYRYSGPFKTSSDQTYPNTSFGASMCSDIRAMIEGRFLAMRNHVEYLISNFGKDYSDITQPIIYRFNRIIVTGGAASNKYITEIMSNIFGLPVFAVIPRYTKHSSNDGKELKIFTETAALGAGYLAKYALEIRKVSQNCWQNEILAFNGSACFFDLIFGDMTSAHFIHMHPSICEPDLELTRCIYDPMAKRYSELEARLIQNLSTD